ncbi:hypothetical protein HN51_006665 [Arachis hypogaea]
MVSTRAAMESRLEAVEKRIEELQEAQQRSLEAFLANILRQMRELLSQQHQGGGTGANDTDGGNDGGRNEHDDERVEGNGAGDKGQSIFKPIRKLDLPGFSGEDPNGSLLRMECYFRVIRVVLAQRLDFATMALEGEALTWFEWWEEHTPFHTWMRFRQDLLKRFQPGAALNLMALLLEVRQVGDVAQYRRDFEATSRTQLNLGAETLMCIFVNSLRKEIQAKLDVASFDNLLALMDRAMAIEWRNCAWQDFGVNPTGRKGEGRSKGGGWEGPRSISMEFQKTPNWTRPNLLESRSEKWGPTHVCPMKHYKILLIEEEEEDHEAEEEDARSELPVEEPKGVKLQLSSYSFWGLTTHKIFKVRGAILGQEVMVLIEPGASANFIATEVVRQLSLPVKRVWKFRVER